MSLEQLPITEEDICRQVVAMGGSITPNLTTFAAVIATKLQLHGVWRNADGHRVGTNQLQRAEAAMKMLRDLQAQGSSLNQRKQDEAHDTAIEEAVEKIQEILKVATAVQAAVATLLGDTENPAINSMRGK